MRYFVSEQEVSCISEVCKSVKICFPFRLALHVYHTIHCPCKFGHRASTILKCQRSQQLWPELRWLDGWHATCWRRCLGRCTGVDEARMCRWKMPHSASSPAVISPISKCVTIITELTFFYPTLRGLDLLSGAGSGRRNIGSNTSCMAWQDDISLWLSLLSCFKSLLFFLQ